MTNIRHELLDLPNNKHGLAINANDIIDGWLPNQRFIIEEIFRKLATQYNVQFVSEIKDPLIEGQNLLEIRLATKYNIDTGKRENDVFVVEVIKPEKTD